MKNLFLIAAFAILLPFGNAFAYEHGTIDTVISFKPGLGQNVGQDPKYFPKNIFGRQALSAELMVQAAMDEDVCSLGFGGEIIVGFKGKKIVDGPGPDFVIFENAFISPIKNKPFVEPGKLSVSEDGINFIDFPFDSLTLIGCAGITPVIGKAETFDTASGGDRFDLAAIGLKSCKYIKIKDISEFILKNTSHPFYDVSITGFDLDAVGAMYLEDATDVADSKANDRLIVRNKMIYLDFNKDIIYHAEVASLTGNLLINSDFKRNGVISLLNLPSGFYMLLISSGTNAKVYKIII